MLLLNTLSLFLDLRSASYKQAAQALAQADACKPEGLLCSQKDDTSDGQLQPFIAASAALMWKGSNVGVAVDASTALDRNAIYEAIRRPEQYLALLDEGTKLFGFALSTAQHCRRISGCKTTRSRYMAGYTRSSLFSVR